MSSALAESTTDADRVEAIRDAMLADGLAAGKEWRFSPRPFPLAPNTVRQLQQLGPRLHRFQRAANQIYFRGRKGSLPGWIADYLDRGKSTELLEIANGPGIREQLPRVIRPDLVLTDSGFAVTEIASAADEIGLTAWLGQIFAKLDKNTELIGGGDGMIRGFSSVLDGHKGADIVISGEARNQHRLEWDWLAPQLDGDWQVHDAPSYAPSTRGVYRDFELSEFARIPEAADLARAAEAGDIDLTAPIKPYLEEALWPALFWMRPLREIWRRELRDSHWRRMQEMIPYSWVMNPKPLPPHAAVPKLEINDFSELKGFDPEERDLVLKISDFAEPNEVNRHAILNSDSTGEEWSAAVEDGLNQFDTHPGLLQEFLPGRPVAHPFWNGNSIEILEGRARLRPYYFVDAANPKTITLGGVLATIWPGHEKIQRGKRDAILVPCCVSEDGY